MSLAPPPRATARTWCGLLALLLPALLISMDLSVLFVAAPAITEAVQPTGTQLLWIMDSYGFVLAGLLITMGALGDRVGRKRLLLFGAGLFGIASAAVAYAPGPEALIAARVLLAIGGATLAPSTLSLIRSMFADENQRRAAVGAWTIAFAGGAVAGPIVGGLLLEHLWWGSVFLINVPVMIVLLVTAPFLLPESKDPRPARFDLPGAALSLAGVLGLVFALKHLAENGIDAAGIGAAAFGAAATAAFVARQRRVAHPLVDLTLFRHRTFSAAVAANTAISMATAGLGMLAFTYLQAVHGLTPLASALVALPTFAGTLVGASAAATVTSRVAPASMLTAGLLCATMGFATVATLQPGTSLWVFIAGYTVLTTGVGITATTASSAVLTGAPPERAGAAAGISETSTELGGALGIAVLGTTAATVYRATMADEAPPGTGRAALENVAAAPSSGPVLDAAHAAYTSAVTTAALVGAVLTALVAVLTAWARRS